MGFDHESDGHDEGHPKQGWEKSRREMAQGRGFFDDENSWKGGDFFNTRKSLNLARF